MADIFRLAATDTSEIIERRERRELLQTANSDEEYDDVVCAPSRRLWTPFRGPNHRCFGRLSPRTCASEQHTPPRVEIALSAAC